MTDAEFTPGQIAILRRLDDSHGIGTRVAACKEREQLRKAGLIYSRPPNIGGRSSIAGKAYRWYLTPEGGREAEAFREPIR